MTKSPDPTNATSVSSKAARPKPAGARRARSNGQTRTVSAGDVSPGFAEQQIEQFVVSENIAAAQLSKIEAIESVIASQQPHDIAALAKSLQAILAGASPDDAAVLRRTLREAERVARGDRNPDTELSDDWRSGGYPYKNLLSRKAYEKQKYHLQVELLKLDPLLVGRAHIVYERGEHPGSVPVL